MERTALRLATVATLLEGGNGPPWPTLAGEFVYDSMIDDVVDVVPVRRKPVIIVRTDDDTSIYKGYAFAGRQCRLLIEFGVLTASTVKTQDGQELPRVDWPRTDSALEAFLDMLELQIWAALFGNSDWAQWWQHCGLYGGSRSAYVSSPRFSPPERGSVRLAVRTIQLQLALPEDCVPPLVKEYGIDYPPWLPPRWLGLVKTLLAKSSGDFRKSVEELQRVITRYGVMPVVQAPPLQRVWATTMAPLYESTSDFRIDANWKIEQEVPFWATTHNLYPPILGAPKLGIVGAPPDTIEASLDGHETGPDPAQITGNT